MVFTIIGPIKFPIPIESEYYLKKKGDSEYLTVNKIFCLFTRVSNKKTVIP